MLFQFIDSNIQIHFIIWNNDLKRFGWLLSVLMKSMNSYTRTDTLTKYMNGFKYPFTWEATTGRIHRLYSCVNFFSVFWHPSPKHNQSLQVLTCIWWIQKMSKSKACSKEVHSLIGKIHSCSLSPMWNYKLLFTSIRGRGAMDLKYIWMHINSRSEECHRRHQLDNAQTKSENYA